jgi:hypothetical protein
MSDEQCPVCGYMRNEETACRCGNAKAPSSLAAPAGSPDIPSVRTLLAQMMTALDAGDSVKYWTAFEAVMKRHEEVIAEVCGPENTQVSHDQKEQ